MRHRVKKYLKFKKKDRDHRDAMLRNLLTSLLEHKSIKTTKKRAKAISWLVDKLVRVVNTKDEMNAIRYVWKYVFTKKSSLELFNVIAKANTDRKSGVTRITPIKLRDGDNATLVQLEIVSC